MDEKIASNTMQASLQITYHTSLNRFIIFNRSNIGFYLIISYSAIWHNTPLEFFLAPPLLVHSYRLSRDRMRDTSPSVEQPKDLLLLEVYGKLPRMLFPMT